MNDTYITPKELAAQQGVDQRTVRRWLEDGKVDGGFRVGGRWRIEKPPPSHLTTPVASVRFAPH